ncbi:Hypothetical protein ORPV_199 [Orpheovirus IHUMI-LCC2]|uniref:Uncharacterized protein n=1 Tax=Orpheovirus IHUMI-LCC2 TaxID=2023057 RepID=A0A2I2L3K6_9VIRU|nr:Hypothetical protein ORPV_199 [Orpheovirus IHUMI-LCC2]SNW62103.1 Hypothetical protein ORPV_199 [Orpheovirus IHUMI-LCC2]
MGNLESAIRELQSKFDKEIKSKYPFLFINIDIASSNKNTKHYDAYWDLFNSTYNRTYITSKSFEGVFWSSRPDNIYRTSYEIVIFVVGYRVAKDNTINFLMFYIDAENEMMFYSEVSPQGNMGALKRQNLTHGKNRYMDGVLNGMLNIIEDHLSTEIKEYGNLNDYKDDIVYLLTNLPESFTVYEGNSDIINVKNSMQKIIDHFNYEILESKNIIQASKGFGSSAMEY